MVLRFQNLVLDVEGAGVSRDLVGSKTVAHWCVVSGNTVDSITVTAFGSDIVYSKAGAGCGGVSGDIWYSKSVADCSVGGSDNEDSQTVVDACGVIDTVES